MVKFLANNGMITLHTAAENGQPSVCCDCLKIVIVGMTPFQMAAEACCDCLLWIPPLHIAAFRLILLLLDLNR